MASPRLGFIATWPCKSAMAGKAASASVVIPIIQLNSSAQKFFFSLCLAELIHHQVRKHMQNPA